MDNKVRENVNLDSIDIRLLTRFNNREEYAFASLYRRFYNEFHLYASTLYVNTTIESRDAVQDVFLGIWQNSSIKFESLVNFKAYVIIVLKNRYKNYLERLSCEKRFALKLTDRDDSFEFDILENGIFTRIEYILKLLPDDYSDILKLYIEGWKPEEIAEKLERPLQTIYNKKHEAINQLKRRLCKDNLLLETLSFLVGI